MAGGAISVAVSAGAAQESRGQVDGGLDGVAPRAVGAAHRRGMLQVGDGLIEPAQRGVRLAEAELDRAHVHARASPVRHVLAAERLELSGEKLDVVRPSKLDGDRQPMTPHRQQKRG